MEDKIYSITDLQCILNIGRTKAYELVTTNKIKAFRIGRNWKITETSLKEFINNSNNKNS